jgi:alpha-amylase
VTALLLYPVIQNHQGAIGKYLPTGYRPKDYFRVDENFGDLTTLRRLIEEAHARGLSVILDLPLGMPGFEHPYRTDPGKAAWFGEPTAYGVRRWDAANAEVADYLVSIAKFWKEQSGCDGFRLDSAQLHPAGF